MIKRQDIENNEEKTLALYAMLSSKTKGRLVTEQKPEFRTVYQRDRDRIVHSTAFRILEYKTQVFVNHEGDYYRTRLTHTIEVAQIARSVARALQLNEDLSEVIALAHDIGHTPFGHAGEEILNEIMLNCGDKKGFEHNEHGLRIVDLLEKKYPEFDGLNLTYEVREGIIKHHGVYDTPNITGDDWNKEIPLLEAQIVNMADELAYDNHDLDDGLKSGLINENDLLREVDLWREVYEDIERKYKDADKTTKYYNAVRSLINLQVTDLISNSYENIMNNGIKTVEDVRKNGHGLISFSKEMSIKREQLKTFLFENMYKHYRVIRMCVKAKRFIQELFDEYVKNPLQLPPITKNNIEKYGLERAVCDYIASMTDRYALIEYKKLFDPYEKV
jgi:dGTPase